MKQLELDLDRSLAEKARGMAVAEASGAAWLEDILRPVARKLARREGSVTADDVHRYLIDNEIIAPRGPFWGSLFKGKEWEFTGVRIKSAVVSNHARELKVWRLRCRS